MAHEFSLGFDDGELDRLAEDLAERVATRVVTRLGAPQLDAWMNSKEAARYLGISLHALRHLVGRKALPFSQDRPGANVYFRASDLDRWRLEQSPESHE